MVLEKEAVNKKYSKTFFALGTINTITILGIDCEEILEEVCRRVVEIDNRMSAFKENSDIMKINERAGIKAQKINTDTYEVLKKALEFSKISKGAFDITVCPLTTLWGFRKKENYIPNKEEIYESLKLVNYRDLILNDKQSSAYLKNRGQAIDLGGIAKGFAADEVKRILLKYNIENALINLGGNIVTMGHNLKDEVWRIGIQNPLSARGKYAGWVTVTDKTIVTSGSNEQFFIKDGTRYHHIIDPRTGYPSNSDLLSVSVICECSVEADAITTAIFVQDINEAVPLLKSINAEAIFIMKNKDIFLTKGLINNFERSLNL